MARKNACLNAISTHMPLARHDKQEAEKYEECYISTHMPLARHDEILEIAFMKSSNFYSHASCEA